MNPPTPAASTIRIMVVDDHETTRAGIRTIAQRHSDIEIIEEADSGEQAIEILKQHAERIDIVLMDIDMPGLGGIVATTRINRIWPQCKVLVLSGFEQYSEGAFVAGARGYVLKNAPSSEIVAAIRAVYAGNTFLSQTVQNMLISIVNQPTETITLREYDILLGIRDGLSNAEIARKHDITENTVKEYVSTILKKLDARNRAHAVHIAMQRGLLL